MPDVSVLSDADCDRLLRAGAFGRVGLLGPRGPEIIPVNYAVHDTTARVRTDPASVLATCADGADLVLEIDLVDHERWQGWSVVARGVGRVLGPGDPLPADPRTGPTPWASGDRTAVVELSWTELSGRRLGSGWDLRTAMPVRRAP